MKYEYWFANVKEIGNKQKRELRSQVESAAELYHMKEKELLLFLKDEKLCQSLLMSRNTWEIESEYEKMQRKGVEMVPFYDINYPVRLKNISAPPYVLYVKGELPEEEKLTIAIVGARMCSSYGSAMAQDFARELAESGVQVLSGLASGIDGIAQRAAVEAGGKSFGILACGVDICYPRENFDLYMELQKQGGILSEQTIGTPPLKNYFPARNRIISGMADVVLVMEAKEKSGSLITADMALEQGKEVYALPGNITNTLSKGCHNLIKQGAGILISPEEFMEELGIFHKNKLEKAKENKKLLERRENIVYSCLDFEPKNPSQISVMTGLPIREIVSTLIGLEMKGYIGEVSKNYYVKVK